MSKTDVLFLFLSFPLLYATTILCLSYQARNPEVEALVHIRGELNDPGGALTNWDEDSVDPCSWNMVTCSSHNLVTALEAPSQGLSGTLSAVIANLTNLRQLLLQNNNISGRIPPELGLLPNLETLDLSNNKLGGPLPDPLRSHDFPALRYLRLNNNSLSGAIPLSLASIPQLALLDLSYNNLSEPVPKFTARTFNILGNPLICHEGCCGSGSGMPHPLSLAVNPSPGHSKSRRVAIALGVGISCLFLILLSLWFFFYRRSKKPKQSILRINDVNDMAEEMSLGNLRNFTLKELQQATGNFSSRNILGAGGFGNVYKGKLGDGKMVAVKRLKDVSHGSSGAGESQFRMELELISLAVHRNLLRLLGYCATPAERLLVYPYMSNGSVAYRLRGGKAALVLDWGARKRIAIGAARGLVYLHEQCDPKIIHRDVKAANVLLDEYDEAVVGDFGLAKLLDHADSHVTTAVRGTVGHIAPEYLSTGQSSDKTDVFGFGILLLELITGMTPLQLMAKTSTTPLAHNDHQTGKTRGVVLLEWVKRVVEEKNVQVLIDPQLGSDYDKMEASEMLQVALHCTQYLPARRPKMSQVLLMLEGEGLAHKWEASLINHTNKNNPNPTATTSSLMQMNFSSLSNNVIVNNHRVDQSKDHHYYSTMSGVMLMEDYDTTPAMELSGPR